MPGGDDGLTDVQINSLVVLRRIDDLGRIKRNGRGLFNKRGTALGELRVPREKYASERGEAAVDFTPFLVGPTERRNVSRAVDTLRKMTI